MKIKTSSVTANILIDHCNISEDLAEQINPLPVKADVVTLHVEKADMQKAYEALNHFMASNTGYHEATYKNVLSELEYFANYNT